LTVAEYFALNEKPYFEYRDGMLTQKPARTLAHSLLAFSLIQILRRQGALAYGEVRLQLRASRYLLPEVCVLAKRTGRSPVDVPPTLCVEILSPGDRLGATFAKCEEYHDWGVAQCWVLDPVQRKAWEYPQGGEPTWIVDVLRGGGCVVDLAELFGTLSELDAVEE
jgi:Uma2 family endonuclease